MNVFVLWPLYPSGREPPLPTEQEARQTIKPVCIVSRREASSPFQELNIFIY
jgi:hypothetical protein